MDANRSLTGQLLLVTQIELTSTTTAAGTLYGIAFFLYCLYLHALLPQLRDNDRRRKTQFMITYSSIIMLCGLYFLLLNAWVIQDAYIKHADFPEGPYGYEESTYVTQPAIAVGLVSLRIRKIFFQVTLTGLDLINQVWKPQNAEYALHAILTILPTILIAGFLIIHSRRQRKLMGKFQSSTPYINVVAMLIESYAMESTWIILSVIFVNIKHPMTLFFGDTQVYIKIIAYLLVLYRVANGRAYGSQSRRDCVTSLHWNHTTAQSVAAGGIDTNIHPPAGIKIERDTLLDQSPPA
ncbi:hypothetical protein AGABI2DRAFT_122272 [Agaricus bisporus var. bisporus H97]|uniref:hypothetical protein n=1 Tax=Agaricus bisporus var. bisporus (strain H97 / ATCC MYA-4626 / FGSC 10389) TaxID=936046 RepID=UPI00029F569A|nr:hypothetical protein AGABI2DRAFT_122272 [Agaricus bisporus var. bisporus H97]EKV42684.1 hypothetical protein AGABI2DRAFT_122272 [Agaricus bisporus var. bisporus H97]